MKQKTFINNKDTFFVGQKVECTYYHEYENNVDSYKRTFLEKFIDEPFKPVKLGIIVGDSGVHPFWLASNGKTERYLLVKFKEYFFAKPIPISCIYDAEKSAERMELILKDSGHLIGKKGYSKESFNVLTEQMNKAKSF